MAAGRWGRMIPGSGRLARVLGVNRKMTEAALAKLERMVVLESRGAGRQGRIVGPSGRPRPEKVRIAILDYEPFALTEQYIVELKYLLLGAGHTAFCGENHRFWEGVSVRGVARQLGGSAALGSGRREER